MKNTAPSLPYRDLNTFLRERFGKKIYKISLSTPFTCPNRDGTLGTKGCLFCSASGSGNFAANAKAPIEEQLEEGKARVRGKIRDKEYGFIAYFQSFSSTYGDVEIQRDLFTRAITDPEVVALSVATRPDCLPEEVLDLLEELSRIMPVWVELGLQTSKEETAELIRRGYPNAVFEKAVSDLRARGLEVIVHLILGLPGEDHGDEIASLRYAASFPIQGVKLHLLHVLRGTALAEMPYEALTMEEFLFRVTDLVRYLPKEIVVHRLTGDGDKRELIAPLWSGDKKRVLNALSARFRQTGICQGEATEK
ncbi:MAG: TIGR01212 family radical SAM protein [Clostridia bacterium]|nr:TIGR01212 family radical SAM protein [Clostridia bacterium]